MPPSFQMKACWGWKCSFCLSVIHNCRPHSTQPWLPPAAFGCHEPLTAIKLLTSQAVPGYRAQEDAHVQPLSPSSLLPNADESQKGSQKLPLRRQCCIPSPGATPIPVNSGGGKSRSGNLHSTEFPRKETAYKQLSGNIPWATVTLLCNS